MNHMRIDPTSCPDELIAKERTVSLSELELYRLNAHCAQCEACRIARLIGADFERILVEPVENDAVDRVVSGAIANIGTPASLAPVLKRSPTRRFSVALVATVCVGLLSASAAAWFVGARIALPFIAQKSAITASPIPSRPKRVKSAAPSPKAVEVLPENEATSQEVSQPTTDTSKAITNTIDLFTRASNARRNGQYSRAVALYMELQRKYPTSPEARLSHVSIGRLLLNRLQEPQMALEQFQQYLSYSPQGSLSEEAMFGKSMALMRLGRTSAEADSWDKILKRNPHSVYEKIARERLSKLR
jgi:TolA-binding protein